MKRVVRYISLYALLLILMSEVIFAADNFSVTTADNTKHIFSDTDGDGYFEIESPAKLIALSRVTSTNVTIADGEGAPLEATLTAAKVWSLNYELTANIEFNAETVDDAGALTGTAANDWDGDGNIDVDDALGFFPIGGTLGSYYFNGNYVSTYSIDSSPFAGSFIGNDYKIKNLFINRSQDYVGFLGYVSPVKPPNV